MNPGTRTIDRRSRYGEPGRLHRWAMLLALASPIAGLILLSSAALTSVKAQEIVEIGGGRVGAVRATLGRSHTLQTSRGFVDLVVGDPEVADVMPLTDRSL